MLIELLFSNPIVYLMVAIAILLGFSVHEYSHAQAAYLLGDPTAKLQGRLTINPLAHFDPLGTLLIFIIGFGWGRPVPFNPFNLRNQKWGPALVGMAGPLSNFFMALFVGLLLRFFIFGNPGLVFFFSIFVWLNLILGTFNLLPIPPLDGSHIFLALLPRSLEGLKISIFQSSPFLIFFAILFMFYIGYPFITSPLFTLITGMPLPF
ncbi:MAG: site-2 protease family protein [Candidatus Nealsonbacteria bacterium CG08_land_8_20_14_0_20_38_20]|uniref:Site-2 protease family protein n=1 Tax=Candidatus Nealsonbacteria bacterium CG08_land_8_20_14_0_20_38_20 TaxID=1974705 RepID=A0A2H0YM46_9BACT|nr:MAG: site-2 protease family protein [Candidatus Nealsonbacteria bacterium CG08_land_8_20_14_0_20_38_20]